MRARCSISRARARVNDWQEETETGENLAVDGSALFVPFVPILLFVPFVSGFVSFVPFMLFVSIFMPFVSVILFLHRINMRGCAVCEFVPFFVLFVSKLLPFVPFVSIFVPFILFVMLFVSFFVREKVFLIVYNLSCCPLFTRF